MITPRLALVCIRFILVTVAAFYGILKLFIDTDASPLLGVSSSVAVTLNTPISTNPTFARSALSLGILLSLSLVYLTIRSSIKEWKFYGHVAPYSSPGVLALMTLFSCMAVYYFVVAFVAGGMWFYSGTLALVAISLSVYEGRQYADFFQVKDNPLDH
jgi:hypothetical protein